MFSYISREASLFLNVENDNHGTYKHSPDKHLESQTREWEPRWHKLNIELDNQIHTLLNKIIALALRDTYIDNSFEHEQYDNGLHGYRKILEELMHGQQQNLDNYAQKLDSFLSKP